MDFSSILILNIQICRISPLKCHPAFWFHFLRRLPVSSSCLSDHTLIIGDLYIALQQCCGPLWSLKMFGVFQVWEEARALWLQSWLSWQLCLSVSYLFSVCGAKGNPVSASIEGWTTVTVAGYICTLTEATFPLLYSQQPFAMIVIVKGWSAISTSLMIQSVCNKVLI